MKNRTGTTSRCPETGNALIIGVIFTLALAGFAMGLSSVTVEESQSNENAGQKQRANYLAETGINQAIADVQNGGTGNLGSESVPVSFGGGTYYVESTPQGGDVYTLVSRAVLGNQEAAYEVIIGPKDVPLFATGLFSDGDVDAGGNVFTDSYNASDGPYADQATNVHTDLGVTYANTNGDLGTNSSISLRGSVVILGDAIPGPDGSISVGNSVHIEGSTSPSFMDRPLPEPEFDPPIAASGSFSTGNSDTTLSTGSYRYTSMTLKKKGALRIDGDVKIWVDGDITMSGQGQVVIEPGATLRLYHAGDSMDITGQGVFNPTEEPDSLHIFSRASLVKFTGSSGFYGAIYAPYAEIRPRGTSDLYGAFVGKTINLAGTADFHYDESLRKVIAKARQFSVYSWRKIAIQKE